MSSSSSFRPRPPLSSPSTLIFSASPSRSLSRSLSYLPRLTSRRRWRFRLFHASPQFSSRFSDNQSRTRICAFAESTEKSLLEAAASLPGLFSIDPADRRTMQSLLATIHSSRYFRDERERHLDVKSRIRNLRETDGTEFFGRSIRRGIEISF